MEFKIIFTLCENGSSSADENAKYLPTRIYDLKEVDKRISEWMETRPENAPVCLTGHLFEGNIIRDYGNETWTGQSNGRSAMFLGHANRPDHPDPTNEDVLSALQELVHFVSEGIELTRVHIIYLDQIYIFQDEEKLRPQP